MDSKDVLKGSSVNSDGYGILPKKVMRDETLDGTAKLIYAYFCSFAGAGDSCFPSRSLICRELKITTNTFSKYLRQLVTRGLISVEQVKDKGKFSHNVYTINAEIPPCRNSRCTVETVSQMTVYGEMSTINNSSIINSNSINNNNRDIGQTQKMMFDTFWKAYPRKVNKQAAEKAFNKLQPSEDLFKAMMAGLDNHKKSKQWIDPQYIPHASTWLNGKRWEDELESAPAQQQADKWDGVSNPFANTGW